MFSINLGEYIEQGINWLTENFKPFFDGASAALSGLIDVLQQVLMTPPSWALILLLALLSWYLVSRGVAIFTLLGLLLIDGMGLWDDTMLTLVLVLASGLIALIMGIPIGIWAARSNIGEKVIRPILDFMQTMPAFVYLIPAVLFFRLGDVPGVVATVIFSMPPAVRLTNLGIREVDQDPALLAKEWYENNPEAVAEWMPGK